MEVLHDVVKAGKSRYLGASSMSARQFAGVTFPADARNREITRRMVNPYNAMPVKTRRWILLGYAAIIAFAVARVLVDDGAGGRAADGSESPRHRTAGESR